MRSLALLFLLCADTVFAAVTNVQKPQLDCSLPYIADESDERYGAAARAKIPQTKPLKEELPSNHPVKGAKRIKIRTGPYRVPKMTAKWKGSHHFGMLDTLGEKNVPKPCDGQCTILRQVAGLEYSDAKIAGKNANIDTGMWLHHMVHFNMGPGRWDAVAANWDPLSRWNATHGKPETNCLSFVGCMPFAKPIFATRLSKTAGTYQSERYFVSGNERTVVNYYKSDPQNGLPGTGYQLKPTDKFGYLIELMNMNMVDQEVYLTMTYDILDKPLPAGWKEVKSVYLDANSCQTSEVIPTQQSGSFRINSAPWKPTIEGKIVYAMGHLHDGGTAIDIMANANGANPLCNSSATYAGSPEYVYNVKMEEMKGPDLVAKDHISDMPGCEPEVFKVKEMKRNQNWQINGYYDYDQRKGNLESGKQGEIMAIAVLLVAVEPGVKPIL